MKRQRQSKREDLDPLHETQGVCHGQGCTLGAGHGPPARDEALGAWGDAGLAEVEGLHSRFQVCLPGQTDQHDVIIVVLGAEV